MSKYSKKLICIMLVVLMVIMILPVTAFADGATVSAEKVSASLVVGNTVEVNISIADNPGIVGGTIRINFDKTKFKLINVTNRNNLLAETYEGYTGFPITNGDYTMAWDGGLSPTNTTTNGVMCTLLFEILATATPGESVILITEVDFANASDFSVAAAMVAGSITLTQELTGTQAVTGVTAPVKGASPDASVIAPAHTSATIKWFAGFTEQTVNYAGDTAYKAEITLTPDKGYQFASDAIFTVDGDSWTVTDCVSGAKILTKTFPATAGRELTTINITNASTIDVPTATPNATNTANLSLTATGDYDDGATGETITPTWSIDGTAPTGVAINGSTLKVSNTAAAGSVTVKAEMGGKSATKVITINKATAALTSMVIEDGVGTIAVPAVASSPYTEDTAFTVTGYDQYGQEITVSSPSWSIDPAYSGLSITATAKLSITNAALAGTATVKVTSGGVTATKDITITKAASVATDITIGGGATIVDVPSAAAGDTTTTPFTATVKDQFGNEITSPTTAWSMNVAYPGVTISADGELTVTKDAAAGTAVIKATCGDATMTKNVTITKAASAVETVKLYKGSEECTIDSIVKPTTGTTTANYTAKAFDQFDAEMTGKTFAWTIVPTTGVSVSSIGTVSVTSTATVGTYTLKASCDGKECTATITVSNKEFATVKLDDTTLTYGDTYTPNPSASVTGGTWSYDYTGISYDGSYTGGTTAPTVAGVYTVTATYESFTHIGNDTATLIINKKNLTITGITDPVREYDGTADITLTGGTLTGKIGSDDVSFTIGTATVADKNVGENKTVTATITLSGSKKDNYTLTQPTVKATITQADVTAATTATVTKVYDGDNTVDTTITFTFAGAGSDGTISVTTSGNTYSDKNVGAGKAITIGTKTATGLENYNVTYPAVTGEITAKPVDITISGTSSPVTFGESFSHTASATLVSGDTATYTVLYDGATTKPTDVGTYTLTATINNTNYVANTTFQGITSFTIDEADITTISDKNASVRDTDVSVKTYALSGFGTVPCTGVWTVESNTNAAIFSSVPSVSGTNLTYTMADAAVNTDSNVVTLKFTPDSPANYNAKTVTLTINVIDKEVANVTVSMENWKYGETAKEPTINVTFADSQAKTNPVWTVIYTGTLSDGSSTPYAESVTKPTAPGSYTIKAIYEDDNHKGENTTSFTIDKSDALMITGLTANNKVYNNTATATVSGAPIVSGKIGSDIVTDTGVFVVTTATFADANIGNNKDVTVTLTGTTAGADAWKYELPATTLTLKANITSPTAPVALGDDMTHLVVDTIAHAYASYNTGITGTYSDDAAVQAKLLECAKVMIPTIGSNIAYYDIELETSIDSGVTWTKTNGGATILFPYPSGTSSATNFVIVHMKDNGSVETPAITKGTYGVEVTVSETSPFAIAWETSTTGGNSPKTGDNSNIVLWITLMTLAGVGCVGLLLYSRKKKDAK